MPLSLLPATSDQTSTRKPRPSSGGSTPRKKPAARSRQGEGEAGRAGSTAAGASGAATEGLGWGTAATAGAAGATASRGV